MKKRFLILCLTILPAMVWAQEVEIGFRIHPDIYFTRKIIREWRGYERFFGVNPFILHALIGLRIDQYVTAELRGGYVLPVGQFNGWELGLLLRSEIVKKELYMIGCHWLHWSPGGYGGITSNTYEKLFHAPGLGVGYYTGTHSSLEVIFLKLLDEDIGYEWYYPPDIEKKKPTKLSWIIRLGFGFSWGLN